MHPSKKAKKIQQRVLAELARMSGRPSHIAKRLGLKQGDVSRALDTASRFLVKRSRWYQLRIAPGGTKHRAGGALHFSLRSDRMSWEALQNLRAKT